MIGGLWLTGFTGVTEVLVVQINNRKFIILARNCMSSFVNMYSLCLSLSTNFDVIFKQTVISGPQNEKP